MGLLHRPGVITLESFRTGWKNRPVLLIAGETDLRIPAADQRQVESLMRQAGVNLESHFLKDCDHFLFFTRRSERLGRLKAWLSPERSNREIYSHPPVADR